MGSKGQRRELHFAVTTALLAGVAATSPACTGSKDLAINPGPTKEEKKVEPKNEGREFAPNPGPQDSIPPEGKPVNEGDPIVAKPVDGQDSSAPPEASGTPEPTGKPRIRTNVGREGPKTGPDAIPEAKPTRKKPPANVNPGPVKPEPKPKVMVNPARPPTPTE